MLFVLDSLENKKKCTDLIGTLNTAEKWAVIIEPYKKKRSNNQNRLYWAWIRILSTHLGMSDEELHEVLAGKFLGYKEIKFRGEMRIIRKSTTQCTPLEFTEYMDKILAFSMLEGVQLPHDFS